MNDANYCINAMYDLLWEIIKENGPCMRRGGGGQMVSMLAFYFDDPSSNPAEIYSLFR